MVEFWDLKVLVWIWFEERAIFFPVSVEKGLGIQEQQFWNIVSIFSVTYLYHLISEMRLMNHHHCHHKRMWRKEVKSRQILVLETGLKKSKYTPSTWYKYLWLHCHAWSCCSGTPYQTIWCPSNILGKVEVCVIIIFFHS